MGLALPREGFGADVAERGFHRVRLATGGRSIRAVGAIAPALLPLAAGIALARTAGVALARPATWPAGAGTARAATGAPTAVLAHGGRLQIIGFRRFTALLVHGLLRHGRTRVGGPGGAILPARTATGLVAAATTGARVARPCGLPLARLGARAWRDFFVAAHDRAAGYNTALIGKWHLGSLPSFGPLKSGYQRFFGNYGGAIDYFTHKPGVGEAVPRDLYEGEVPVERVGYYTQLLADAQADLEAVALSIETGQVRVTGLQGEIDRIHREITALGPVNLAALEELTTSRERKTFLDSQNADLTEAMNTLEDAIRKIDAETRDLLGGTFKIVNEHFSRMFPELFGGGNARLVMTGDEILDAGVQVLAQPPGKKNQTIHLLSGGEKALTAIALVFAIFQLNPAPFCLLDEVDAPLDDANTERYAKLVAGMGKETQFLFISHNKIAMEMAEQLIGVTMQEQGVSRIVAVDMESAVSMADI